MAEKKIIWSKEASGQFEEVYEYLLKEASLEIANRVMSDVLDAVDEILIYPFKFEKDRFRRNNSGEFRARTIYHYRITYRVRNEVIEIVQIRHTSRKPKYFG